jgi:exoribonuclease R
MNRKNRNARFASSASTELNTYLYFKNIINKEKRRIIEEAMVMRVTKAGIYVMIKSFGVEGLLTEAEGQTIAVDTDKEVAIVNGSIEVRTFDALKIEVVPTSVEFRRKINFVFIEKISGSSTQKKQMESVMEVDESTSLADAKRSKKKKKQ